MNEFLKKIYENVLLDEDDAKALRKEIDDDVALRLAPYQELLDISSFEKLKSDVFASCYLAENIGFQMGVKFMKRL